MWQYDMRGHVKGIVQRYCEIVGTDVSKLRNVKTPCIDDHEIHPEELEIKGELASVASSLVLQILSLIHI